MTEKQGPVTDGMIGPFMAPYLGADVYYIARGSLDGVYPPVPRVAKIVDIPPPDAEAGVVTLFVMNPSGIFFTPAYHGTDPGQWCWDWEVRNGQSDSQSGAGGS